MTGSAHDNDPGGTANKTTDALAGDREQVLQERRAKQIGGGSSRKRHRILLVLTVVAGGLIVLIAAVGPKLALKYFGMIGDDWEKTSHVDLEVKREPKDSDHLDFGVPAATESRPQTDPNAEINKRFQELQQQLEAVARADKTPEVSLTGIQQMLDGYKQDMDRKLDDERERASAENARLRAEAERLEEDRKRAEQSAKLETERNKKLQDIANKQQTSTSIVVDESGAGSALQSNDAQAPDDLSTNQRFLSSAAGSEVKTSRSRDLPDPSRTIVQGTIISAVLETAINTELPGNIRAQIIEPVFSFNGTRVLFPAGTTLVGTFNESVEVEQKRVLIAWNRAITPEGKSIGIGSIGTDLLGRSGTAGNVDNRYGKKIGAAVLLSAITALPSTLPGLMGGGNRSSRGGTTINVGGSSGSNVGSQLASGASGELSGQGKDVLGKYLSLPPIIRVPQGEEIRVFVNRDLIIR